MNEVLFVSWNLSFKKGFQRIKIRFLQTTHKFYWFLNPFYSFLKPACLVITSNLREKKKQISSLWEWFYFFKVFVRVEIKAVLLFICRCCYQLNWSGRYFSSSSPHVALGDKTAMYRVNLPFHDQPYKLSPDVYYAIENFLRSDHVSFWNSLPSMSAIFLSDTADHRSYMVSCYHEDCDNINRVTSEML